jgi:hypothetical protein
MVSASKAHAVMMTAAAMPPMATGPLVARDGAITISVHAREPLGSLGLELVSGQLAIGSRSETVCHAPDRIVDGLFAKRLSIGLIDRAILVAIEPNMLSLSRRADFFARDDAILVGVGLPEKSETTHLAVPTALAHAGRAVLENTSASHHRREVRVVDLAIRVEIELGKAPVELGASLLHSHFAIAVSIKSAHQTAAHRPLASVTSTEAVRHALVDGSLHLGWVDDVVTIPVEAPEALAHPRIELVLGECSSEAATQSVSLVPVTVHHSVAMAATVVPAAPVALCRHGRDCAGDNQNTGSDDRNSLL